MNGCCYVVRLWQARANLPAEGVDGDVISSPQAWAQVVTAMRLSPKQRLGLVQLRRAYLHNLALLSKRRAALAIVLQVSLLVATAGCYSDPCVCAQQLLFHCTVALCIIGCLNAL